MKFDLLKMRTECSEEVEYNWVEYLPVYQIIYNTGFHKSIGLCPCIKIIIDKMLIEHSPRALFYRNVIRSCLPCMHIPYIAGNFVGPGKKFV